MWLNREHHAPSRFDTIEVKSVDGVQVICHYFDDTWRDVDSGYPIEFIYWNRQP